MVSLGQAGLHQDQVAIRAAGIKEGLDVALVAVHDQFGYELDHGLGDLGLGHGAGLHVGVLVFFQQQGLGGTLCDLG